VAAEAIPKIIDGIKSSAQIAAQTTPSVSADDKFPEDFDIKDELKFDKEVYKYTG
tara:strand:+ start:697 stop:861 length:165 start_codon:yes stop_codon:yes gene_type:complete